MAKNNPVQDALIKRLNRKLAKQGYKLVVARNAVLRSETGKFYLIDREKGNVIANNVNLESLARKWDVVLRETETAAAVA